MEKMSDAIFHEAQEYYQKVTSLYAQNKYEQSYELGNIWLRNNNTEISEIVKSSKNAIDAIHKIQDTWLYSVNVSDKVKENAVDWLLDNQKRSGFDLFKTAAKFQESKYSNPDNNVVRNNRILTPDFLRITSYLNQMKRFCKMPKSKFAALELGAGCGHLARVMKLAYSHCSYVIIDIPETLIFSYMFLRLNFPKAKTLYVACEEDIDSQYLNDFDFVFVPTMFAEKILNIKYHLFINTASMGEMNNKIIRYWMGYVQNKLKVDYLFTFNRYLNSILVDGSMDWRLNENECSVHYDSNWDILNWELEPSYSQCPFVDTIITRNVEIVAQKTPPLTLKQKKSKSKRLYLDVMDEDWVRISKSFSAIMTKGDNLLNNDLSMSGTLFKLWDSIRYEPNENNVALILRYLARLLNRWDIEFEEVFYYESLFRELFTSKDNPDLIEVNEVVNSKILNRKKIYKLFRGLTSFLKYDYTHPVNYESKVFKPLVTLIEDGYKDFNIVEFRNKYYGFSKSLGKVDLFSLDEAKLETFKKNNKCVVSESLHQAKALIDKMVIDTFYEFVTEDYKGFNIIFFRNMYYGFSKSLGDIDILSLKAADVELYKKNNKCVTNWVLDGAKYQIDEIVTDTYNKIILHNYKGFNIIFFRDQYYGFLKSLGEINLFSLNEYDLESYNVRNLCVVADSLNTAKGLVDDIVSNKHYKVILDNYKGFSICASRNKYYSFSKSLGEIDLHSMKDDDIELYKQKNQCIESDTFDNAKTMIDELVLDTFHEIVAEDYKGFNIVMFRNKYYGIAKSLGKVDLFSLKKDDLESCKESNNYVICDSLGKTKILIDEIVIDSFHEIVNDNYKGFNIVLFRNSYYGFSQSLGKIDLLSMKETEIESYREQGKCIVSGSLDETKKLIDEIVIDTFNEIVVEDYKGFNIVEFRNRYYGFSKSLGKVDLFSLKSPDIESYRKLSKCVVSDSLAETKFVIDEMLMHEEFAIVLENYKGFNIGHFRKKYYGIPTSLGKINLRFATEEEENFYLTQNRIVVSNSIEEVKLSILMDFFLEEINSIKKP